MVDNYCRDAAADAVAVVGGVAADADAAAVDALEMRDVGSGHGPARDDGDADDGADEDVLPLPLATVGVAGVDAAAADGVADTDASAVA